MKRQTVVHNAVHTNEEKVDSGKVRFIFDSSGVRDPTAYYNDNPSVDQADPSALIYFVLQRCGSY